MKKAEAEMSLRFAHTMLISGWSMVLGTDGLGFLLGAPEHARMPGRGIGLICAMVGALALVEAARKMRLWLQQETEPQK